MKVTSLIYVETFDSDEGLKCQIANTSNRKDVTGVGDPESDSAAGCS